MTPMIWLGGFGGLDARAALAAGLWLALPITLTMPVMAQERPDRVLPKIMLAQNDNAQKLDALKQHDIGVRD